MRQLPVPDPARSQVVAPAPGEGPGHWVGAPSAVLADDGSFFLAYRVRFPVSEGRGVTTVVARSFDGVAFEEVAVLHRQDFGADSFERPALVAVPDGGWRLYVSSATPGSKHWRVDLVEAKKPSDFPGAPWRTVLAGDDLTGVKDPVVVLHEGVWHLWLCCHPLDDPEATDRMYTRHGTSVDGVHWRLGGVALAPRPGTWDARGARVASVLFDGPGSGGRVLAFYDGRATAGENAEERTGLAVGDTPDRLSSTGEPVARAAVGTGSLRYVTVLPLPGGGWRLYYEVTRRDGAHDLRTEYVPPER